MPAGRPQGVRQLAKSCRPRIAERRRVGGAQGRDDRLLGDSSPVHAAALDDRRPDAADDKPPHARILAGEQEADDGAHRVANKIDLRCAEDVEQHREIAGHAILAVAIWIVRLLRAAVASGVGSDDPVAGSDQSAENAGADPIGLAVNSEPVMQDDGRRLRVPSPLPEEDLDAVPALEALRRASRICWSGLRCRHRRGILP